MECLFHIFSLYISLGGSPLPVHRQGGFLFRAVRGCAAGGQGGHCHRGNLFFSFFFLKVCFRSRSCCSTWTTWEGATRGSTPSSRRPRGSSSNTSSLWWEFLSSFPPFFTHRARCACSENFFFHCLLFSPYRAKYARCEIFIEIEKQGVSPICRRTSRRVQFLEAANGRQGIARSQWYSRSQHVL